MDLQDIFFMIIYPVILMIIQIYLPKDKIRPLYLIIGFILLFIFGISLYFYFLTSTQTAKYLIALSVCTPIIFAFIKFLFLPFIHHYNSLKKLPKILGAIDWGVQRTYNIDAILSIASIRSSFDFMGFGFSKYLKAKENDPSIENKEEIEHTFFWQKLKTLYSNGSTNPLRILIIHPMA